MRALILMLGLLAAPAVAADQFDLVCHEAGNTVRYRVDLQRREACSDACDRTWKTGDITAGELKLIDRAPAYRGDLEERLVVNRQSGDLHYSMSLNGNPVSRDGHCERAPFTGFPAPKF